MNIRPMHDRVLLRRKDPTEVSTGGLFIPVAARETSHLATVVSVGTGKVLDSGTVVALKVEPGQTVLLGKWAGDEVKVDGEDHLIVRESDILAVVD